MPTLPARRAPGRSSAKRTSERVCLSIFVCCGDSASLGSAPTAARCAMQLPLGGCVAATSSIAGGQPHTERERRQPGCLKQLSRGRLAAARCAVCVRSVAVEIHWWGEIRSDPWHNRRSEEHPQKAHTQTLARRSSRVFIARTGMTGAKLRDFCPRDAFSGPPWRTAAPRRPIRARPG